MKNIKKSIIGILSGMLISVTGAQAAYDDPGTDYTTDVTESWISMGPSMEPLDFTSFLVCIMGKTGASQVVNGSYNALIDTSKCQTAQSSSKPEIAKVTVTTSRADNSSPQIVKVWFDISSTERYLAETTVTEGVSSTAPYGSFTMSWAKYVDDTTNSSTEKGTMTFAAGSTSSTVQLAKLDPYTGGSGFTSMNGAVQNDKTTGQVAVAIDASTYGVSFNSTHVNIQKDSDPETCTDRTSITEYVHGYNIYDAVTGARKTLSGPFQCTYTSGTDTKYCHIGPYGAWFEGGETNIASVTHEDGTDYSLIYDTNDDGTNIGTTANDGVYLYVTGYSFDEPVIFAKADQVSAVQTAMGNSSFLEYFGEGSLYGLPWQCSTDGVTYVDGSDPSCSGAIDWRPAQKLTDGTSITDTGSNGYVTKAKYSMKVMAADPGNCGALDLSGVTTTYPALTTGDISAVSITWSDKPTVTAAPSVIDGVLQ